MRANQPLFLIAILTLGLFVGCARHELRQARQAELAGDNAHALELYHEALEHASSNAKQVRSAILMRMGECLFRMGRITDAFSSFQQAVDADPANTLARLRMGEMFLSAGDADRARAEAETILKATGTDKEALALLGAAWAASDNDELAKRAYERVLELDPKGITVAVALADLYNRDNDVGKAKELLHQAIKEQPGSSMPLLALARLSEQEGEVDNAESAYRRAVAVEDTPETNLRLAQFLEREARVQEAEQVLRKVDAQRRSKPVALADFQLLSGHAEQAAEGYRQAMQQVNEPAKQKKWAADSSAATASKPEDRATVAARLVEADITTAAQKDGKERESAIAQARRRLESCQPQLDAATSAMLQAELAVVGQHLGLARLYANAAVQLASDSAPAHYVLGLVESASGNDDAARQAWTAALDNDPHFEPAHLMLARDALARGAGADADEHARAVVRDNPGDVQGVTLFAKSLLAQGKPNLAVLLAERAQKLDPSSEEPSVVMGDAALQQNQTAQALIEYERAVVKQPNSEEAIDGLMRVYQYHRVSYAALRKMEKAAVTPPVSSTLLEIAGRLYAMHGWYTDAARSLSKCVELDPQRSTARRLLAQLQLTTGNLSQAASAAASLGGSSQWLLSGYHEQLSGDWKNAAAQYEQAVRDGDETGIAANNLAWLYAEHSAHLDRALTLAENAIKASPDNPAVLDTAGFVHLQRREYTDAVKLLEAAARLTIDAAGPNRDVAFEIRKHLSDAYLRTGETQAATLIAQNRGPLAVK